MQDFWWSQAVTCTVKVHVSWKGCKIYVVSTTDVRLINSRKLIFQRRIYIYYVHGDPFDGVWAWPLIPFSVTFCCLAIEDRRKWSEESEKNAVQKFLYSYAAVEKFNWFRALRGPSAIAERLVLTAFCCLLLAKFHCYFFMRIFSVLPAQSRLLRCRYQKP